tara:strand:+ start:1547 stop:1879 length:333 start_codon:yes stop_codon:yes gene_type:complete
LGKKTPEAKVRDPVITWAKKNGIHHIRMYFGPGMRVGWPDDLFLIPGGRPVFLEAKALGKLPTEMQWQKIELLEEQGYDVWFYDKSEAAIAALTRALERARLSEEGSAAP